MKNLNAYLITGVSTAALLATTSSSAAVFTWDGDNGNGRWANEPNNWVGNVSPDFDTQTDIKIAGTVDLDQNVRSHVTIRSLEFTNTNTANTYLGLVSANGSANRHLTFSADSGNSTLVNNTANGGGTKEIGRTQAGVNTGGRLILGSNLDVTNNGSTIRFRSEISGANDLSVAGTGTVQFYGVNTYTGDTTVTGDNVVFANNSQLKFDIGADGVNNGLLGTGTVRLDGDFLFDLASAGTTVGNSWLIVDVDALTENFDNDLALASVAGGTFTEAAGLWSVNENGVDYQFAESTGLLTVVPEPGTYALLAGLTGLTYVMLRRRRS